METAPLKSFAPLARTALINEVTARTAVVLAPGSSERVEQRSAVAALEKAIDAAGGGDAGRAAVAERVAYTWFNRIIALRFMDTNGYTGVGLVSPQAGVEVGQPEILADAKRGAFDPDVISPNIQEAVSALLDGTRQSGNPQGEAYALLLAEYCRHWHRAMPFMFERAGDFTELLMPANLLADESVLNRAVKVMTTEVCKDVEVIGWLYQFYISERKEEVFAGFKKGKKAGSAEIPSATQLFTPHWIVKYLVENSVGRLWMLNRPNSRLVDQMAYYIAPVDEETDFLKISGPEGLTVIDPACGSGHMLTYAFDLLYAIYEEEGYSPSEIPGLILTKNIFGTEIDPRAGALAAFALTMKARARQRTFFSRPFVPNVHALEPVAFDSQEISALIRVTAGRPEDRDFWLQFKDADTRGALIKSSAAVLARLDLEGIQKLPDGLFAIDLVGAAETVIQQALLLSQSYHVLIANPPYMGAKNIDVGLATWAKNEYQTTNSDLFSMFMDRAFDLVAPRGYAAMVTMDAWMFLSSYKELRGRIIDSKAIRSVVHMPYLGRGATSMGINFGTVAAVIRNSSGDERATFQCVRYFEIDSSGIPLEYPVRNERYAEIAPSSLRAVPDSRVVYWLSDAMVKVFARGRPLASIAEPRQGLLTGDSQSFVRHWWEVSIKRTAMTCGSRESAKTSLARWFPYNKGGEFRRWYGNHEHIVNWENDGKAVRAFGSEDGAKARSRAQNTDYYFRPSVSWSNVGSGSSSFRAFPPGFIAAGSTGDGVYPQSEDLTFELLGILNSSVTHEILAAISPTLTFNVGTIGQLPIILPPDGPLSGVARELYDIARHDWNQSEMSWEFAANSLIGDSSISLKAALGALYEESDKIAARARLLEIQNNETVAELYGLKDEVDTNVALERVSLGCNIRFKLGANISGSEYWQRFTTSAVKDLVSYAIGCMFGRYSLDEPGLILADQGVTIQDSLTTLPTPTFSPDADNVIPIVDGDWFEDDIVARFRHFLRVAFGEKYFEENLRLVIESLGVKELRDYFAKRGAKATASQFYEDHVQRYKKRPIYWLFSSPNGSFNALIYMHRYTSSTVSTVLNEYLREYKAKLTASLENQERLAAGGGTAREQAAAQKEADRLRKVLLELDAYEHDVLYPLASQQVEIDLDDGVKANYSKFGTALKKIPGLEAAE
jgi:hypothetical protein